MDGGAEPDEEALDAYSRVVTSVAERGGWRPMGSGVRRPR